MYSSLRILICVAFTFAATGLTTAQQWPPSWQSTNNWGFRPGPNIVGSPAIENLRTGSYNQNWNIGNDQGSQSGNSEQSDRENNIQQSWIQGDINPSSVGEQQIFDGRSWRQEGSRNQGSRGFSGSISKGSSGRTQGQRQSQYSGGLRNIQTQNLGWSERLNAEYLQGQRSGENTRSGLSQENNNEEQQELQRNNQKNGLRGFSLQNLGSNGDRVSSEQAQSRENLNQLEWNQLRGIQGQSGKNSNQLGWNQLRGIQGELRGYNNGRQQILQGGWNQQRLPNRNWSGRNTATRQESREEANQEGESNSETLNANQSQREGNQNDVAQQQQPNIYTYGELSAKILKVIQSNPSMLSNMNGLIEQLQNNEDSGNQQVRQLKSLLREMGRSNGNQASSGARSERRGQNELVKNLLDVMNRNNQYESSIPTSYQSFRRWEY